MSHRKWWLMVPASALLAFSLAQAQDAGGQPGQDSGQRGQRGQRGDRGDRGARGSFDPAQARQQYAQRMKEQLGATDEEWRGLQPKLERVSAARRELEPGRFGMLGGGFGGRTRDGERGDRGGDQARPAQPPRSKVGQARNDLSKVLENKDASSEEITRALTAYREARDKARAELAAAQKELKEAVTARQEAVLVMNGTLE